MLRTHVMRIPAVVMAAVVRMEAVITVIVVVPGPVIPGIIVPGIVVPGAVVPGMVIPRIPGPAVIVIRIPGPAAVIPGAVPIIIVPQIPGPIIPRIGIIQRPDGRGGIHDGNGRWLIGETNLAARGHNKGIALAENIGRRLFTQSKEIVGLFIGGGNLRHGRGRPGVYAVVEDLGLESGHGRAG